MSKLWRLIKRYSLWDTIAAAPRGIMSRVLALWTVLWCSLMATWVVYRVFSGNPPDIPAGTVAAFSSFLGACLGGAWAFFRWASGDKKDDA